MSSNSDYFLKKTLGDDFFESLTKFELWKPGTRTTIDHEEIKTALQIVPRTLMSFIIHHLSSMDIGETKETQLPINEEGAVVRVTKHEHDVYSGDILQDAKIIVDFKYRSIPGVALVIMSAFELYDTSKLIETPEKDEDESGDGDKKIQFLIDERLALHDLIGRVVDKKLMEKDAIKQLVLAKLTENIRNHNSDKAVDASETLDIDKARKIENVTDIMRKDPIVNEDEYFRGMANGLQVANSIASDKEPDFVKAHEKKESPLKGFLKKREQKNKPNAAEFVIQMAKGEHVNCPDCGKNIFNGNGISACICYGDSGKIYLKKFENKIKISFGKSWDPDNIEMLLNVLRNRNKNE